MNTEGLFTIMICYLDLTEGTETVTRSEEDIWAWSRDVLQSQSESCPQFVSRLEDVTVSQSVD